MKNKKFCCAIILLLVFKYLFIWVTLSKLEHNSFINSNSIKLDKISQQLKSLSIDPVPIVSTVVDKNRSVYTINESMNTFNLTETKLSSEKKFKKKKIWKIKKKTSTK